MIRNYGIVKTIKSYLLYFSGYTGPSMHMKVPVMPPLDYLSGKNPGAEFSFDTHTVTSMDIIRASLKEIVMLREYVTELEGALMILHKAPIYSLNAEDHEKVTSVLNTCYDAKQSQEREDWGS